MFSGQVLGITAQHTWDPIKSFGERMGSNRESDIRVREPRGVNVSMEFTYIYISIYEIR